MKIRAHRSTLAESMETVQEIKPSIREVAMYFNRLSNYSGAYNGMIKVGPYCYDKRINWDTHIVTLDGNAIGFMDAPIK